MPDTHELGWHRALGATLHLSRASRQPVAGGQSRRVRSTPDLLTPNRRREADRQTDGRTRGQRAGDISRDTILGEGRGERGEARSELGFLPKRRRKVRCDSSPNFWSVPPLLGLVLRIIQALLESALCLVLHPRSFGPLTVREESAVHTKRARGEGIPVWRSNSVRGAFPSLPFASLSDSVLRAPPTSFRAPESGQQAPPGAHLHNCTGSSQSQPAVRCLIEYSSTPSSQSASTLGGRSALTTLLRGGGGGGSWWSLWWRVVEGGGLCYSSREIWGI